MDAKIIMTLRRQTGAGVLDAKVALEECEGDVEKAADILRKKGQAKAAKKSDRETSEGSIASYVHATGKVGAMVAMACETDFVAMNEDFKALAHDIAMHITAAKPQWLSRSDVPEELLAKERDVARGQAVGKPEDIVEKIVEGKVEKFYAEHCVLEQTYIKDEDMTVQQVIDQAVARLGENIQLVQFSRFSL
jgi:elongation factor Ts